MLLLHAQKHHIKTHSSSHELSVCHCKVRIAYQIHHSSIYGESGSILQMMPYRQQRIHRGEGGRPTASWFIFDKKIPEIFFLCKQRYKLLLQTIRKRRVLLLYRRFRETLRVKGCDKNVSLFLIVCRKMAYPVSKKQVYAFKSI